MKMIALFLLLLHAHVLVNGLGEDPYVADPIAMLHRNMLGTSRHPQAMAVDDHTVRVFWHTELSNTTVMVQARDATWEGVTISEAIPLLLIKTTRSRAHMVPIPGGLLFAAVFVDTTPGLGDMPFIACQLFNTTTGSPVSKVFPVWDGVDLHAIHSLMGAALTSQTLIVGWWNGTDMMLRHLTLKKDVITPDVLFTYASPKAKSNNADPSIMVLNANIVVVTWTANVSIPGAAPSVQGQSFFATATAISPTFDVSMTRDSGAGMGHTASALVTSDLLVTAWQDPGLSSCPACLKTRLFAADGKPLAPPITVYQPPTQGGVFSSLVPIEGNTFVVVWTHTHASQPNRCAIHARIFEGIQPLSDPFMLIDEALCAPLSALPLDRVRFLVTWISGQALSGGVQLALASNTSYEEPLPTPTPLPEYIEVIFALQPQSSPSQPQALSQPLLDVLQERGVSGTISNVTQSVQSLVKVVFLPHTPANESGLLHELCVLDRLRLHNHSSVSHVHISSILVVSSYHGLYNLHNYCPFSPYYIPYKGGAFPEVRALNQLTYAVAMGVAMAVIALAWLLLTVAYYFCFRRRLKKGPEAELHIPSTFSTGTL